MGEEKIKGGRKRFRCPSKLSLQCLNYKPPQNLTNYSTHSLSSSVYFSPFPMCFSPLSPLLFVFVSPLYHPLLSPLTPSLLPSLLLELTSCQQKYDQHSGELRTTVCWRSDTHTHLHTQAIFPNCAVLRKKEMGARGKVRQRDRV